jgi:hypothetical protein
LDSQINNFIVLTDNKILNLSKHPKLGKILRIKNENLRCTLIHKRVLLIYNHKPKNNEIDLLVFCTYQNPQKLLK